MATGINVSDIMVKELVTITKKETIRAAIKKLVSADVGALVIIQRSKPIGILTRGDILRAIANDVNLDNTEVSKIMTSPVITIKPNIDVEDAAKIMRDNNIKRLPVVDDDGNLVGLISETDIIRISPALYEILKEKEILEGRI